MAIGKSGYFDLTGSNTGFALRVNWSETYEITTNQSVVTIDSVQIKSTGWSGFTYYPDGKINVNGETVIEMSSSGGTHSVRVDELNEWYDILSDGDTASGRITVTHDNDGSKSVSIEVAGNAYGECRFYTAEGGASGGNGWYAKGEKIVVLTNIPRASTIGASDANIGSKSTIVVTQKSTAYTHSISYRFGSLTGYITASGGVSSTEVKYKNTSISWTIPTTFYAQIPNAKTGTCTLTITTYSGSTQIGDAQTGTFVVTAAQSACAPSVSGSVVDSNATTKALTGDDSTLVRYYSTALCTITAAAKNSATISAKKIGGTTVSGNTRSIAKVEVDSVSFYAKDSRGYEASADVKFTLVPYLILTNNASGQRTDPTSGNAKLTIKGDYFNGSFGAVSNSLTIKYRFREVGGTYGSYTTVAPTISGNSYTVTEPMSGLDYENSYEFEVVVSDKLETVRKTLIIKEGIPVFDWGKTNFAFHVPVKMNSNRISGLATPMEDGDAVPLGYATVTKLLWTNASPGSTFAAQTISLDLSDYDLVFIKFRLETGSTSYISAMMEVGSAVNVYSTSYISTNGYAMATNYRTLTISASGVVCGDAYRKSNTATTAGEVNNILLIPVKIFGIKGVQ